MNIKMNQATLALIVEFLCTCIQQNYVLATVQDAASTGTADGAAEFECRIKLPAGDFQVDKESGINVLWYCNISTSTGDAVSRSSVMYEFSGVYTNGMVVIYPQQNISAQNKTVIINQVFVTNSTPVWLIVSAIGGALSGGVALILLLCRGLQMICGCDVSGY